MGPPEGPQAGALVEQGAGPPITPTCRCRFYYHNNLSQLQSCLNLILHVVISPSSISILKVTASPMAQGHPPVALQEPFR